MKRLTAAVLLLFVLGACSSSRRMAAVRRGEIAPRLDLASSPVMEPVLHDSSGKTSVMVEDSQGRRMYMMRSVRSEDGEDVASEVIAPAMVSARFRNVAERRGRVELRFDLIVPGGLMESDWQIRLQPVVRARGDSTALDPVYITGALYRRKQLRGYQHYRRFVQSIVRDSSLFVRESQLELFLRRNLPEVYALRTDTCFVSDERFESLFGVTGREALEHYTDHSRKRRNSRKKVLGAKMYERYVAPPSSGRVLLDSVVATGDGDLVYNYSHVMTAAPDLRKAEVILHGEVYRDGRPLCRMPSAGPLSFYISSLSTLAEDVPGLTDPVYIKGVDALRRHDYKSAVTILAPYADFNAALSFCALGYDATALSLLEALPVSPRAEYLKALIYSRMNDDTKAAESFDRACRMDPSFVNRGNLDPEISKYRNTEYR